MSKRWESSCQTLQRTITVAQYSETSDWNHPSLPLELAFKVKKNNESPRWKKFYLYLLKK